jgi:hypothetical protein
VSFAGHDHKYQQYLKNGIHYVITGGGAPLYDVDKPTVGTAQKAVCTDNFVRVCVDGTKRMWRRSRRMEKRSTRSNGRGSRAERSAVRLVGQPRLAA